MLEVVKQGHISLSEASERLGISYRHGKRLWKAYQGHGDLGLIHKSRGRPSNRGHDEAFKASVLSYYEAKLGGFGPTFASEKLADATLAIDHETLRRWLVQAQLWSARPRRHPYRKRRERRACFGELVQFDGSFHDWFGNGKKYCLMNMVDDATGVTYAQLFDEETTEAAMRTLGDWIDRYGVPQALYTDKRNVYVTGREPTLTEQLAGEDPLSAFGLACKKLGITVIRAHSPQAKGRVERSNGTYQDRLIKELRFQNIKTVDSANELLRNAFCQGLNDRFACAPKSNQDGHRKLKKRENLYEIFCWEEERQLQNDWTVRFKNTYYQIDKAARQRRSLKPKIKLLIRVHLDNDITILYKNKALAYQKITERPAQPNRSSQTVQVDKKPARRQVKNIASPWRRFNPGWLKKPEQTHDAK